MNLYKIKYTFVQPSFMIVEADDLDEAVERFKSNTEGALDAVIREINRLDEVPETSPVPKNELN